jgi:hypothetical protein
VIEIRGPQLAFGAVLRVARRFKQTFAAMVGKPGMLRCLEVEPESLLGRDRHNNTLLHLLLADGVHLLRHLLKIRACTASRSPAPTRAQDHANQAVEVLRLVERRFGRVAAQRLLRVRNEAGEMALHIALRSGTSLRTNADSLPRSLAPCVCVCGNTQPSFQDCSRRPPCCCRSGRRWCPAARNSTG